jgi:hypothetical protein
MAYTLAKSLDIAIKDVILNSFYPSAAPRLQAVLIDSICSEYGRKIKALGRLSLRDSCRAKKIGPIREF